MNLSMISKNLLPGLALLLATSVFAANAPSKGTFTVDEPVTVGGHQLAAGEYQLKWNGTGSTVELSILSHKKLVATVPAQLIELDYASLHDGSELHKDNSGAQSLTQIDFAHKKYALVLGDASAGSASEAGNK